MDALRALRCQRDRTCLRTNKVKSLGRVRLAAGAWALTPDAARAAKVTNKVGIIVTFLACSSSRERFDGKKGLPRL